MNSSLLPDKENLHRAVDWLGKMGLHDRASVEEAALKFDLSPLDEDFLLAHFVETKNNEKDL